MSRSVPQPLSRCFFTPRALRARLCRGAASGSNKLSHIRQSWLRAVYTCTLPNVRRALIVSARRAISGRPDTSSKSVVHRHRHHEPSTCQKRANLPALSRKPGQPPPLRSCTAAAPSQLNWLELRGPHMLAALRARSRRMLGTSRCWTCCLRNLSGSMHMRPCLFCTGPWVKSVAAAVLTKHQRRAVTPLVRAQRGHVVQASELFITRQKPKIELWRFQRQW